MQPNVQDWGELDKKKFKNLAFNIYLHYLTTSLNIGGNMSVYSEKNG